MGIGDLAAGPKSMGLLSNVLGQQARLLAYMDIFRVVSILALLVAPLPILFQKTAVRSRPPAEH